MPTDSIPVHSGTPYFMGEHALIKFSSAEGGFGPETFWLADKKLHTLRPFESHAALQNAFGDGFDEAMKHVVHLVAPRVHSSGEIVEGVLRDYNIMSPEYAIKEDGSAKKLHFSPHQLRTRYGKPSNAKAESDSANKVEALLDKLKKSEQVGVSADFVDKIKKEPHLMAFYISALAYGGYHIHDVFTDIFRRAKRGE